MNISKRNTIQKQLVLDAVFATRTHPTVDEIYSSVHEVSPQISKATVYRNLNELANSGSILKIPVPNAGDRYDFNTQHHNHLLCTNCGKIFDSISTINLANQISALCEPDGFSINSYQLLLTGICKNCQQ